MASKVPTPRAVVRGIKGKDLVRDRTGLKIDLKIDACLRSLLPTSGASDGNAQSEESWAISRALLRNILETTVAQRYAAF